METAGVGTKSRPETSSSVGVGDIIGGKRDVYIFEARFGEIKHFALLKFLWCVFSGKLP